MRKNEIMALLELTGWRQSQESESPRCGLRNSNNNDKSNNHGARMLKEIEPVHQLPLWPGNHCHLS